ncbi:MAG: nucleoside triphosphate pyrophosphohydrolase [Bdellovibrionia bacterium]
MSSSSESLTEFQTLVEIVAKLRSPQGCPWDREQTHHSLTQYAIEELYELIDAIESENDPLLLEELGDNLFQVILHAQLAVERKAFTLKEVISHLNQKLVRRHPHVFANQQVSSTEEVIANWEKIKKLEKAESQSHAQNPLNVPLHLPALQRAYKIGKRTEKLKFDWDESSQVYEKFLEEERELKEAIATDNIQEIEHEIGDVLFTLAQLARHLQLEPEAILRNANRRFEQRFNEMLKTCSNENKNFETLSAEEKNLLWEKAKSTLQNT